VAIPYKMTNGGHTKRAIGVIRKVEKIPIIQRTNSMRIAFVLLDMVIGYGRKSLYQSSFTYISRSFHGWHNRSRRFVYILLRRYRAAEINQCKARFTNDRQGGQKWGVTLQQ